MKHLVKLVGETATPLINNPAGRAMKVSRSSVIAKARPTVQKFILTRRSQCRHGGKTLHESPVVRDYRRHLGLLKHNL